MRREFLEYPDIFWVVRTFFDNQSSADCESDDSDASGAPGDSGNSGVFGFGESG